MKTVSIYLIFALAAAINSRATILTVPGSFPSIQQAINASSNGDTIAVSPGTWHENINFRGKKVLLTSLYYLASDTSYMLTTVINGSSPVHPDTASCVIFNSGEDTTSVLQGFTITGGTGTKWLDIHGAGLYREGGGVLVELSSPTIRHNIITNNTVSNTGGVISSGGGGIRIGDGNPRICNNVISFNQGRYGAGIVLNYTGCVIRNNVIFYNTGGQEFYGGAGIWIYNNLPAIPKIIENNTIVYNYAAQSNGTGGISVWSAANVILRNNIVRSNQPALQVKTVGSTPQILYCNVQGGATGTGNIDLDPDFSSQNYLLSDGSPCIDAGDTAMVFNDLEDLANPGSALFPSRGLLRNDMGAYGGPFASMFPAFATITAAGELSPGYELSVTPNPFSVESTVKLNLEVRHATLKIYNSSGQLVMELPGISGTEVRLQRKNLGAGFYHLLLVRSHEVIARTKLIITN